MIKIVVGDCLESMRGMDSESVHCCVTSPPYWGLRDYGHDGQIGLEESPDEFVGKLVEVFREVRRVLKDDGTLWLNLGDSYAGNGAVSQEATDADIKHATVGALLNKSQRRVVTVGGLKPKNLVGIPWRVAFALQADGWWLRQDIIWHKPNPMAESVTDRCTKAHEYIFLLAKSQKYYYDIEPIREPIKENSGVIIVSLRGEHVKKLGGRKTERREYQEIKGANKRSVWTVTTKPFSGAHFATFPPDLIEPCILAGCPVGGTVLDPFGGAGTTGLVAQRHERNAVLCELNPEYAKMAGERIKNDSPMFSSVETFNSK